ncbi:hypothetical protein H9L39_17811 [Fusarium oxysporum f. sp. albedinis]|nr:hypothetical protein H9L39_17811 [Fusarium oxysporum f. sp. albedinis]
MTQPRSTHSEVYGGPQSAVDSRQATPTTSTLERLRQLRLEINRQIATLYGIWNILQLKIPPTLEIITKTVTPGLSSV